MNVDVQYFAILREQRGISSERITTGAAVAGDLYDELQAQHGFTLPRSMLRVVVNESFGDWNTPLRDGDSVVFIPPVAGG